MASYQSSIVQSRPRMVAVAVGLVVAVEVADLVEVVVGLVVVGLVVGVVEVD